MAITPVEPPWPARFQHINTTEEGPAGFSRPPMECIPDRPKYTLSRNVSYSLFALLPNDIPIMGMVQCNFTPRSAYNAGFARPAFIPNPYDPENWAAYRIPNGNSTPRLPLPRAVDGSAPHWVRNFPRNWVANGIPKLVITNARPNARPTARPNARPPGNSTTQSPRSAPGVSGPPMILNPNHPDNWPRIHPRDEIQFLYRGVRDPQLPWPLKMASGVQNGILTYTNPHHRPAPVFYCSWVP